MVITKHLLAFKRVIYKASRILNTLGTVVVMALMLLIVVDVILRNLFNSPIQGSFEIVEFMMVVLVFFFFANGQIEKGNVAVDMFVRKLPTGIRRFLNTINYFIATVFFAIVTVQLGRECYDVFSRLDVSPSLHIPKYPFILAATIGALFLTLVLLIDFLVELLNAKSEEIT